ncbi:unnamed protein product [Closterium sp. NIES-64]|nr:unnamed protein product [Closterium sp. NIES-64]
MPDQRSHGRGSLAASAAAVAATTAAGAPWGAANYGSAVGSSTSFARNTRGKRVLVKATSMPPAVESRRPSSGAGSATSGGSARTPRLPAGRPQQRQQFFPPTNAPGHAAAHPSPRARLLSAKSPRAPSAAPHGVAQVSFASPRSFRGGAGMPVPPNQQLRALAQSRSLPPQSPASAARAAAAVANVKACAFPKSPSGALSMGGRPSSGSGMAQGQARTGAGRELAPRTPRQLSASGQSNRAGPALSAALLPPEPEGGEQMDRGEQRDGVSDRKTAAALRRSGSSEAVHRVGGNAERGGLKAEGAGGAERTAGKSGEQCVQFEESTLARKGSGKGAEENRLRAAVAKGQERKLKAEKSVKGTVAKEKGSGVTRKVSREGKSKEEVVSPVMVKQCLLPWLSKKA